MCGKEKKIILLQFDLGDRHIRSIAVVPIILISTCMCSSLDDAFKAVTSGS